MNKSSTNFILDNVIICNSCQKAMVYSTLTGGIKTGYVCRNQYCAGNTEIEEEIVVEVIRESIKKVVSLANADHAGENAVWRMLEEPPEIVSKWLSENFRIYVSATISGGVIERVDYI